LSFQEIASIFDKIKGHISNSDLTDSQRAYPWIRQQLDDVRKLYLNWINVYEEYRGGFEKENLTASLYPVARFLSSLGYGVESNFFEVIKARIPVEVYLLVRYFFQEFHSDNAFVLGEGRIFGIETVYDEISTELRKLPAPEPHGTQARTLLTEIEEKDCTKITYESIMYDSALTWPLLLHEVFHEVYDVNKLESVHGTLISSPWVNEVIIDLYCATFLGPVYAVSLAKYHQRFPIRESISHPGQAARLYGLLQLLQDMLDVKANFSNTIQRVFERSFKIVDDIWLPYRTENREIQEQVQGVYEKTQKQMADFHHSMGVKPFSELVANGSPVSLEFDKILSYVQSGIPLAAEPRILFNALVVAAPDIKYQYVAESLKKWHLWSSWTKSRAERQSKLS
jgi:hypothetical protein